MNERFRTAVLLAAACSFLFGFAAPAKAQFGGGVLVDAEGVLRTRYYRDTSVKLFKRRLEEARAHLKPDLARPSELRKISLNRLEAAVAEQLRNGAGPTDEMKYLAGLTGIDYVFCYPETGDIVIAGPAEGFVRDTSGLVYGTTSGRNVMELRHLLVALRSFAPGVAGPRTIGVSIDPTKEGLQRMQQFLRRVGPRATPRDTLALAKGLKESLGLQTVTIMGVSPKTHFAHVLVEADYRMKLIGIGLETPPVKMTSYVERANPASVARNALQRWYFVPNYECVKVSEDELAMQLVGEGVKLVGSDELVTAEGGRVGSGRVDKASKAFVDEFTRKYPELAARLPIYAQLRNLIDMAIAAAFIQQQDYYGQTGWKMEVFGSEKALPLETGNAPTKVETAVNAIWKGRTLMTPIGGGVSIRPRTALQKDKLLPDSGGEVATTRKQVDLKSIPADRWWWD